MARNTTDSFEARRPAGDLLTALDNLEPGPLSPGSPEWTFYVENRTAYQGRQVLDAPTQIQRDLEREARRDADRRVHPKMLISGHRGAGKSTELNRMAKALSESYAVIPCSAAQYINRDDVSAQDLLFVLVGLAIREIEDIGGLARIERDAEAKAALELIREKLPPLKVREGEIGFKLLGGMSLELKFETNLRRRLRQVAEARASDLCTLINRCYQHLAGAVERPVLVILDDLDKVEPGSKGREQLFGEEFPLLLEPEVTVVYTVPMDVYYNHRYTTINAHEKRHVIGHIKLWTSSDRTERFEPGGSLMREFVARRVEPALFADGILDRLIELSGGSFEQLRRLVSSAVDHADYYGTDRVEAPSVDHAVREVRTDLVRTFTAQRHRAAFQRIHEERSIETPDDLGYLPLLAVLESPNGMPWYDINPLLVPLVEQRDPSDSKK